MTQPAATMLLKANFDINQVGETLEWSFTRADHDGNPIEGIYAGGIYYTTGEEMNVRVDHRGQRSGERFSLRIVHCRKRQRHPAREALGLVGRLSTGGTRLFAVSLGWRRFERAAARNEHATI